MYHLKGRSQLTKKTTIRPTLMTNSIKNPYKKCSTNLTQMNRLHTADTTTRKINKSTMTAPRQKKKTTLKDKARGVGSGSDNSIPTSHCAGRLRKKNKLKNITQRKPRKLNLLSCKLRLRRTPANSTPRNTKEPNILNKTWSLMKCYMRT